MQGTINHGQRTHDPARSDPLLRQSSKLPRLLGKAPLAERRDVSSLYESGCSVPGKVQSLALPREASRSAVHTQDWNDYGGLPHWPRQVACGYVADCELQERY